MRIKHTMGPVSLKLYDKFGLILRIETTVNDLTFFKHYREVEHRDGTRETKWAPMQKTIYNLPALRELLESANRRYLEFLSTITDPRAGRDKLDKLSRTIQQEDPTRGSICSTPATTPCFERWCGESSTSADCRTRRSGAICRTRTAGRFASLEAPSYPRPYQESGPHLQVLPDAIRQGCGDHRPQTPRTCHHPQLAFGHAQ